MVVVIVVVRKIGGRVYQFSREDVEHVLKNIVAEPLSGRKRLYIEYQNKKIPVKQIISELTGLPRSAFTTAEACDILIKLGFEIKEWRGEQSEQA